jgi:hypothetical protein
MKLKRLACKFCETTHTEQEKPPDEFGLFLHANTKGIIEFLRIFLRGTNRDAVDRKIREALPQEAWRGANPNRANRCA